MRLDEVPGEIRLLARSGQLDNQLRRRRGRQFITERKRQCLFREIRSERVRHRAVEISFFFDTLRFESKLVQLFPRFLIGISPDHTEHRRPKVRRKHLRIG